jgi:hypothetical protein
VVVQFFLLSVSGALTTWYLRIAPRTAPSMDDAIPEKGHCCVDNTLLSQSCEVGLVRFCMSCRVCRGCLETVSVILREICGTHQRRRSRRNHLLVRPSASHSMLVCRDSTDRGGCLSGRESRDATARLLLRCQTTNHLYLCVQTHRSHLSSRFQ